LIAACAALIIFYFVGGFAGVETPGSFRVGLRQPGLKL
jgi:hypothetical protein